MTITHTKNTQIQTQSTKLIKLDRNENPLGAGPFAIAAGQQALIKCHRYPDSHGLSLKKRLATHWGTSPENITLGNGSEELLELISKLYLSPQHSAIIPNFCFTGIAKIILNSGARLTVAKNTYSSITASTILAAIDETTKVIFIVNPNNPTGNYINQLELSYLLNTLPHTIFIVIDEAYGEYVEANDYPDTINLLTKHPNLIITKTFSKFYGLAGLRLGYTISTLPIAKSLKHSALPFNVNSIALAAAQAALNDQQHIQSTRLVNRQGLLQLTNGLQNLGLQIIPSFANFICVDLKCPSWPIYQKLLAHGISVRPLHDYGLVNHLRISIGTEDQNNHLLTTLKKIVAITNYR